MRAVRFDSRGGIDKSETSFDVVDAFIMWCYDLKEFDYTSTTVTMDGKIDNDLNLLNKKSKSVIVKTEVFEWIIINMVQNVELDGVRKEEQNTLNFVNDI